MFYLTLETVFILLLASYSFASGGAEKPSQPEEATEIKTSEDSFFTVQARVQALEAKVHSAETEITKLIAEKNKTTDSEKVTEVIRQMITLHRELENYVKEYDQQRTLLKYRYPDKGVSGKREYERINLRSIEEMENHLNINTALNKTLKKVRIQFPVKSEDQDLAQKQNVKAEPQRNDQEHHEIRKPASSHNNKFSVDPIILKK